MTLDCIMQSALNFACTHITTGQPDFQPQSFRPLQPVSEPL